MSQHQACVRCETEHKQTLPTESRILGAVKYDSGRRITTYNHSENVSCDIFRLDRPAHLRRFRRRIDRNATYKLKHQPFRTTDKEPARTSVVAPVHNHNKDPKKGFQSKIQTSFVTRELLSQSLRKPLVHLLVSKASDAAMVSALNRNIPQDRSVGAWPHNNRNAGQEFICSAFI
jgi:hypothetical protein